VTLLALGSVSACGGPALTPGFESVDPQERTTALLEAARAQDRGAISELIERLWSSDPAERMLASAALRRLTGQDFGYRHFDPETVRDRAAEQWRRWWLSQQERAQGRARPIAANP